MSTMFRSFVLWTARAAGILYVLFLSLFALDIFGPGHTFWETVVGLSMHLLPSIVLTLGLIFAWRRPWIGAVVFLAWALLYMVGMGAVPLQAYALIAGIPALIAILFLIGWISRRGA